MLGTRIRELRKATEMTINELAKKSNISRVYLSEIERNVKTPPFETLGRICDALGTTLPSFFADQAHKLPPEIRQIVDKAQKLSPRQLKILNDVLNEWVEKKDE